MACDWPEPAYRITTERLVIRCYDGDDLDAVHATILANADALHAWMPWIREEPKSREDRAEQLRRFRGRFDLGEEFVYGIFERGGRYIGGTGLHPGDGVRSLEIGYWILPELWGNGLATETAAALTKIGFERMEAERMVIRIAPHNVRSRTIPPKLGYTEEGTLRRVLDDGDGRGDLVVYGMLRAELANSPAARARVEAEGFSSS